jgi:hypothetical protein
MTDKPLKTLNGKKFEDELAEPIETGLLIPVKLDDPSWPEYFARRKEIMTAWRLAKMPSLALHLGIDPELFDLSTASGISTLCTQVAMELAAHVVPGFQEKSRGKWPREIVSRILFVVDVGKQSGKFSSDLEGCKSYLMHTEPDLARPCNKSALDDKSHTLQNLIVKERVRLRREGGDLLHKKPRLSVVK